MARILLFILAIVQATLLVVSGLRLTSKLTPTVSLSASRLRMALTDRPPAPSRTTSAPVAGAKSQGSSPSSRAQNTKPPSSSLGQRLQFEPVRLFGKGHPGLAGQELKFLLGGKGANLAEMSAIGLAVPPGFTITTEVCQAFHKSGRTLPAGVWEQCMSKLQAIELDMGKRLGDPDQPLLLSVRSGAAVSMPGMLDTVLNLGLNDETVKSMSRDFGERFALDSYRRFLNMFGEVVVGIPHHDFEEEMNKLKERVGAKVDADLTADHLRELVVSYKKIYEKNGKSFPQDPFDQLYMAIFAVFDSWESPRAIKYREAEGIFGLLGTAVNIQTMVFGNMGDDSGTGVCFTRNPNTGERKLYGEYLVNAQGEDVVAGIRTPLPIETLAETMPHAYQELLENVQRLEENFRDMQDIEFTVERGQLFMLQTRGGKRGGQAAVKIAVDMVNEGLLSTDDAIMLVKPEHLNQLLHPQFKESTSEASYKNNVIAKGLPASPGAAVGKLVLSPEKAEAEFASGQDCILVRDDTSPEDVGGMWAAKGLLTARGGMTSHAAVVARGWGKTCVCGCSDLKIDYEAGTMTVNGVVYREGDYISLNGDTGEILKGKLDLKPPSLTSTEIRRFMQWVDDKRRIKVLTNADTPEDAQEARRNGAQGIGLTRTEHMFFSSDRINVVRRMILAPNDAKRKEALDQLLPFQRSDFEGMLEAMDGFPISVRLLDPPLHEFLPAEHLIDDAFAAEVGLSRQDCIAAVKRMEEVNPMLGLRGCRLGITLPELTEMQVRALFEAAVSLLEKDKDPRPEIMIPLVGSVSEFIHQRDIIRSVADKVFSERGKRVQYKIGTMIEVPRAALLAKDLVKAGAEFFSYGTNDLTQTTYAFSRDDVGAFMPTYLKSGILERDPFVNIDEEGVGQLIKMSAAAGKRHGIKVGVCGEHGGDPMSIRFFIDSGLDYISCSPSRLPIARLAAAQCFVEVERKARLDALKDAVESAEQVSMLKRQAYD